MTVLAIDPGISIGIAIHTHDTISPKDLVVTQGEYVTTVRKSPLELLQIIKAHNPTHVIFEDFNSPGLVSKDGQATLRLVGAIEVICYMLNISLVLQFPREIHTEGNPFKQQAKAMLKQIKPYPITHEIDALAHLLVYEHRVQIGVADQITSRRRRTYNDADV